MDDKPEEPRLLSTTISLLIVVVTFAGIAVAIIGAVMFFPGTNGQAVP